MAVQLTSSEKATWGSAPARAAGTSATYPSRIPPANADFFDTGYILPQPFRSAAALLQAEINGQGLRVPLLVWIEYRDGFYEIEHQELAIFGRGRTTAEAVQDFLEYLIADYHAYAEESDQNLDKPAQELARRYRWLFGKD